MEKHKQQNTQTRQLPDSYPSIQSGDRSSKHTPIDPKRRKEGEDQPDLSHRQKPTSYTGMIAGGIGVVALVIGLILINFTRGSDRNFAKLAAQYVKPYPRLPLFDADAHISLTLMTGLQAYKRREFAKAATSLAQVPPTSTHYRVAQYYLGISLLAMSQYAAASQPFRIAANSEHWEAYEPAHYYLAVSLVGQGLPDAACTWLNPNGYHLTTWYGPKVKELYGRFCP